MRAAWGAILLLALISESPAAEPPKPDYKHPVNYIEWLNKQYGVADAKNAAATYRRAIAAFKDASDLKDELYDAVAPDGAPEGLRRFEGWVRDNENTLELLAAATRMRKCYFDLKSESGALEGVFNPVGRELRELHYVVLAHARLRLVAGDFIGATEDALIFIRMARHFEVQPGLVSRLAAWVYRDRAYALLLEIIDRVGPAPEIERVATLVRTADTGPPNIRSALLADQMEYWDRLQRHVDDSDADGEPDRVRLPEDEIMSLPEGTTWKFLVEDVERHFAMVKRLAGQPDYPKVREIADGLENPVVSEFKLEGLPGMPVRLWDTWVQATCKRFETMATYRAVRIILELHVCRSQHGSWPTDLKVALPSGPADLMIDPFSGQEFKYRVKDAEPLLYSVSRDGVDDDGRVGSSCRPGAMRWSDNGDYVFWPRARR